MNRKCLSLVLRVALPTAMLLLAVVIGPVCAVAGQSPVFLIRLKPVAELDGNRVLLGDIATVESSAPRSAIAELRGVDLLEMPPGSGAAVLRKSLVNVRLQLHGLSPNQYRLIGPDLIACSLKTRPHNQRPPVRLVSSSAPRPSPHVPVNAELTDLLVEDSIRNELAAHFSLDPAFVRARLTRPFVESQRGLTADGAVRVEVISPGRFPYGQTSLTLRVCRGSSILTSGIAQVHVERQQSLVRAVKAIPPGRAITPADVEQVTQYVNRATDELTLADVVGRQSRRILSAGEALTERDLSNDNGAGDYIIKARDSVRVTANRSGFRFVIPAAEALQSGRAGQFIRVRNVQSGRTIIARVTGPGEAEVPM